METTYNHNVSILEHSAQYFSSVSEHVSIIHRLQLELELVNEMVFCITEKLDLPKRLTRIAIDLLEGCYEFYSAMGKGLSINESEQEARAAACIFSACMLEHTRWTCMDIAQQTNYASSVEILRRTATSLAILRVIRKI